MKKTNKTKADARTDGAGEDPGPASAAAGNPADEPAAPPAPAPRRFNWKAAAVAAALVVVGAGALHGVRWLQVDRLAEDIRDRALAAEEDGDQEEAFRLLAEYRQFRPDDLDATVRSARLLDEVGGPGGLAEVIRLREAALRQDPSLDDVRRALADDLLELAAGQPRVSNFNAALVHIERLQEEDPQARDAELLADRATAEAGVGRDAAAAKWFLLAIDRNPGDPELYVTLARLLNADGADAPAADVWSDGPAPDDADLRGVTDRPRSADRAAKMADDVADLLVRKAGPRRTALLRRGQLLRERDRPGEAADDARAAFAAVGGATDPDVLRFGAEIELELAGALVGGRDPAGRDDRLAQARRYLDAADALPEPDPRLARLSAQLELADGYAPEAGRRARATLNRALDLLNAPVDADDPATVPLSAGQRVVTEWQTRTLLAELAIAEALAGDADRAGAAAEVGRQLAGIAKLGSFTETTQTLRGRAALLTGDVAAAVQDLDRAAAGLADGSIRVNTRGGELPVGEGALSSVNLFRADAYARLQNPERAISILQEALRDNPNFATARQPLALLLARKNDVGGALRALGPIAGAPAVAPLVAELMVRRELAKPVGERDFSGAEAAVAAAERAAGEAGGAAAVAPALLKAQLFAAQENYGAAGGALVDLLGGGLDLETSIRSSLWRTRLALELTRGDVTSEVRRETAERLLDQARADVGETPEVRIAKVAVASLRGPEIFRDALREAADEAGDLPPAERTVVRAGLIRLAAENGRAEVVRRLWADLARDDPDNLAAHNVLAEFALADLQPGADQTAEERAAAGAAFSDALAAVRRLEGPGGPNGERLAAARVLADADASPAALADAGDRLDRALRRRPLWPEAGRLQGFVEQRLGNDQAAYEWFTRARTWGDRSQDTLVRVVQLLRERGRQADAAALLKAADRQSPGIVSGPVARLAWQLSAELNETDRLVELSTRLVRDGGTAGDRLLRALSLAARYFDLSGALRRRESGVKLRDEAAAAFEAVTEAAPGDVGGWLARLRFLKQAYELEQDGPKPALKVVDAALEALPDLSEPAATVREARLREAAGDLPAAAGLYAAAASGAAGGPAGNVGERPTAVAEAAAFYLRYGDRAAADPLIEALSKAGADLPPAVADWLRPRRDLADAVTGRWENVPPALEKFPPPSAATPEQLRSQLALLGTRSSLPFRELRIERLSALAAAAPTTGRELLELATLLESTGRWEEARPLFETVRQARPDSLETLAPLIRGAALHESVPPGGAGTLPDEAADRVRPLLDRLREVAPDADLTKLTGAEFAAATGDRPAAAALLRSLAGLPGRDDGAADDVGDGDVGSLQRLNLLARTAERLKFPDLTDELYLALQERSTRPEDKTLRAAYLARTGRHGEALDLVERFADEAVPEATAVRAVQVVVLGRAPGDARERAAALVETALRAEPGSPRIQQVLADLNAARGRLVEAERQYRELLAKSPDDTDLLNNLAWLLASAPLVSPGDPVPPDLADEPLRLLARAEAVDGPTVNLRDTAAMMPVLAHAAGARPGVGALGAAAQTLDELARIDPSPTLAFHAAAARWAAGDPNAGQSLDRAFDAGLSFDALHPSEHPLLRRLLRDLDGSGRGNRAEQ